jgi:cytochrome b561
MLSQHCLLIHCCGSVGLRRTVHFLLYATVIVMPLAGWIGSVAASRPPYIDGVVFDLPIASSKLLVTAAFNVHRQIAIAIIVLASIHILAAFYHHWVKKDNILRRMLPRSER